MSFVPVYRISNRMTAGKRAWLLPAAPLTNWNTSCYENLRQTRDITYDKLATRRPSGNAISWKTLFANSSKEWAGIGPMETRMRRS